MSRRLARALGVRLVAIALGLIAGLVVLEIALQLAAVVTRSTARDADVVSGAGVRHVLAVGDSNTYGLYLDREQAYPAVFAQRENAIARERVSVVNAAFPGVNSSQLRNLLPELLRSVRPTDVFVMVGANDWWTLPEPIRAGGTEPSRPLWLRSRVLRLFVILERWFEAPAVLEKDATPDSINAAFKEAASDKSFKGVLEFSDEPLVSEDIVGNPHSCIFDSKLTLMLGNRFVKVVGWYDNEWGYSNRCVQLMEMLAD